MNGSNVIKSVLFAIVIMTVPGFRAVWSAELMPLRASYAAVSGAVTPLWLAQDKGFFAKYGLAVDLKYILPATATQALLANSLDIANPGGELMEAGLNSLT